DIHFQTAQAVFPCQSIHRFYPCHILASGEWRVASGKESYVSLYFYCYLYCSTTQQQGQWLMAGGKWIGLFIPQTHFFFVKQFHLFRRHPERFPVVFTNTMG